MLKRISCILLAFAMVYGDTFNNLSTGANEVTGVAGATGATGTTGTTGYTPKISEQELATAQRAPVYTSCVNPGQVAFTFDDGPNPATTSKVLDFLKEHNIIGTFFITAQNKERTDSDMINLINHQESFDIVKRTVKEGHYIGSHTFYHEDLFLGLDNGRMEMNIDTMTDKIYDIIGTKPIFFRPPLGNGGYDFDDEDPVNGPKNEKVQKYLGASGFKIIMWGADTRDWENRENVEADIAELNKHMSPQKASPTKDSFIILMHDIYDTTADLALPRVYDYVTSLGYKIVSLTECLGMTSAYQNNIEPNIIDSSLTDNNMTPTSNTTTTSGMTSNDTSSATSSIEVKIIYSVLSLILFLSLLLN